MNDIQQIAIGVPADRGRFKVTVITLCIVFVLSIFWSTYTLATHPGGALWGFLLANFIFLLGISQFGIAFSAMMRICNANWARSYYRLAELSTLAFAPLAIIGFIYIYCYGSEHLFYWLADSPDAPHSPWLDHTFLFYRNLIAQLVFYTIAIIYFLMGLLPDISIQDAKSGPAWRNWLYRKLLSMKKGKNEKALQRKVYLLSPVILIAVVIPNTLIAWDFGMMLIPHYHSTIFPMYFIMGNMFAGTAAILILAVILSRYISINSYFQTVHVQSMGVLLTGFALLWLYFFWAQFFVSWFGNLPNEYGVLAKQMYGHYAPVFWIMIVCNFFIPIACLIFLKVKQTWWMMILVAIIINLGIWLNRYLIVVPALVDDHYPLSSLPEFGITAGLVSGFLLFLFLLFNTFPVVSMWELRNIEKS
ncbi:MAG: polysulfide reductase NrfD [Proteobacteria bacterium]|nr:polysulfide reductase NrfD [Pseudomonadota bacterium]